MFSAQLHITHLNLFITAVTSLPQYYCLLYSSQPLTLHLHFVTQFVLKNDFLRQTSSVSTYGMGLPPLCIPTAQI